MDIHLTKFTKKWNLTIKKPFLQCTTKLYLNDELVGEFDSAYRTYWVTTTISDEFVKDFLAIFGYYRGFPNQ